jgi:Tfp pilus assembly PilM family ATPase
LGVSFEQAEAMKFDLARGFGAPNSQSALDKTVQTLVSEIRGSLDYYLSQEESQALTSVIVTGGGSLTAGLAATLEQSLRIPVHRAAPLSQLNVTKSGLSPDQIAQIEPVAAAAVGLAMGAANR